MKRLLKPSAFEGRTAIWVNPSYLPESLQAELLGLLPKSLQDKRGRDFISACGEEVQFFIEERASDSAAIQVEQLQQVKDRARSLLQALNSIGREALRGAEMSFQELAVGTEPPIVLEEATRLTVHDYEQGRFFGVVWDFVSDLEQVAQYTIEQCRLSRQAKVSDVNARRLVYGVAGRFRHQFGQLPPHSKNTWFVRFVRHLGKWEKLKLSCGPALVLSVFLKQFKYGSG